MFIIDLWTRRRAPNRVLRELNIDIICAKTPQAKDRVERANSTLQDRLVKELRLAGIDNMDDANAFVPSYLIDYNRRFGKVPSSDIDIHRPLRETDNLDYTFCWREQRKLSKNLVVHYKRVMYLVEPTHENKRFAQNKIDILEWVDGSVELWCDGVKLDHTVYDKAPRINEAAVVDNKRLGAVLSFCNEVQKRRKKSWAT